jgi:hypothetical protein
VNNIDITIFISAKKIFKILRGYQKLISTLSLLLVCYATVVSYPLACADRDSRLSRTHGPHPCSRKATLWPTKKVQKINKREVDYYTYCYYIRSHWYCMLCTRSGSRQVPEKEKKTAVDRSALGTRTTLMQI